MIPLNKHPSPWYNIHDVSRGSISTEQILPRNLKTWEKLSCSHILYFVFFSKIVERAYGNRIRGDLLTASEYWEFFLFY